MAAKCKPNYPKSRKPKIVRVKAHKQRRCPASPKPALLGRLPNLRRAAAPRAGRLSSPAPHLFRQVGARLGRRRQQPL